MGDMNAPLRVKIRDGCRGGKEQFTWNSIKDQDFKDREQYLGQSTKIGMMGKFGRYYMHDWYARKRDTPESIESERTSVKAYEEELMQEALGLKPKKLLLAKKQLTEEEVKEILMRDDDKTADKKGRAQMGPQAKIVTNEYGEQVVTSNEEFVAEAAREAPIKGLGFAVHRNAKLEAIKAEALGTESELAGTKSASSSVKREAKDEVKDEVKREQDQRDSLGLVDAKELTGADQDGGQHKRALEEVKEEYHKKEKLSKKEKKQKKADKKLKKLEKKLKKAAKREKKAAKLAKKEADDSSSSSSS